MVGRFLYYATMVVAGNSGNSVWEAQPWNIVVPMFCFHIQWDIFEYVNCLNQGAQIAMSLMDGSIHVQQRRISGTTCSMKLEDNQARPRAGDSARVVLAAPLNSSRWQLHRLQLYRPMSSAAAARGLKFPTSRTSYLSLDMVC